MTEILPATAEGIAQAARLLMAGHLVAFPTETVYGLGADASNDDAVRAVFDVKGRPPKNPLIVHVYGKEKARQYAARWPEAAQALAEAFWPGPLTLVVPAAAELSRSALGGGNTVGLRAPDHPVARSLLNACKLALAAPSANRSGSLSPVDAEHVLEDLRGRISAIVDGGPCHVGLESTVVDLTGERPVILRPGVIGRMDLQEVLRTSVDSVSQIADESGDEILKSPGLMRRHYAPRIPLRLKTREQMQEASKETAVVFLDRPEMELPQLATKRVRLLPGSPEPYGRELYRTLWELQAGSAREIWIETPPEGEAWEAVHDRLQRASFDF